MDEAHVLSLFEPYIESLGRRYASTARRYGIDREDIEQVARIGALAAIRSFDPAKGELAPFVRMAAKRDVLNGLVHARRHRTLQVEEGVLESIADPVPIMLEAPDRPDKKVKHLTHPPTRQELAVLRLLAEGLTPEEIGQKMFLARKSVYGYIDMLKRFFGRPKSHVALVNRARAEGFLSIDV